MEDREGQILAALHQHEGWTSRAELARILGRRRLNQADFEALAVLQVTRGHRGRKTGYFRANRLRDVLQSEAMITPRHGLASDRGAKVESYPKQGTKEV